MELFKHPEVLIWTALAFGAIIPFLLWANKRRDRLTGAIGAWRILARLVPGESRTRRKIKLYLLLSGTFFVFISWAGPQWGVELIPGRSVRVRQVVIAVDTSLSMSVQDIKPSRMENAKVMLSMLMDRLSGSRIGIVAFSGNAHIQCPLTTDTEALKTFLSVLSVGMLPQPGTAVGEAIRTSAKMLARYPGQKGLILLTDGEDHKSDPAAAGEAAEAGIKIFTVGLGNPEGDVIPVTGPSGTVTGYKKDKKGQTVVSKLGERDLIRIAAVSGGAYIRYSSPEAMVSELSHRIRNMGKTQWEGAGRAIYKNRFQITLFIAWLLLLVEFMMSERHGALEQIKSKFRSKLRKERR